MGNTNTIKQIAKTLNSIAINGVKIASSGTRVVDVESYIGTGRYVIDPNGYIGAILPDPPIYAGATATTSTKMAFGHDKAICVENANFAGMGLGHVAIVHNGGDVIGGKKYRTVKIGNQIWLAENLSYKYEGLLVGNTEIPMGNAPPLPYYAQLGLCVGHYPDNNPMNESPYGLLYSGWATRYLHENIDTLAPGWRIPTRNDFYTLADNAGGNAAYKNIASKDTWNTAFGEDLYGLGMVASGFFVGTFQAKGVVCMCWMDDATGHFSLNKDRIDYPAGTFESNTDGYSIRLVKDA